MMINHSSFICLSIEDIFCCGWRTLHIKTPLRQLKSENIQVELISYCILYLVPIISTHKILK